MTAARVYVGNLDPNLAERDLRDQFEKYGPLRSVWIARKPPGFAFVEYEDERDAGDAVKRLDGRSGWKVEFSRRGERSGRGGPPGGGFGGGGYGAGGMMGRGRELRCYECNEVGHLARDCRLRIGGGGGRRSPPPHGRSRSPVRRSSPRRSPRYSRSRSRSPRRSPSYDKRRSPPRREASRSRSPARRRSPSPKSRSRSPAPAASPARD